MSNRYTRVALTAICVALFCLLIRPLVLEEAARADVGGTTGTASSVVEIKDDGAALLVVTDGRKVSLVRVSAEGKTRKLTLLASTNL
jgi:hypothetical protein